MFARYAYSVQLQHFLENSYGLKGTICNIFYNVKHERLLKTYDRVLAKAKKNADYQICLLGGQSFRFVPVPLTEDDFRVLFGTPEPKVKKSKKSKQPQQPQPQTPQQ
ncbi:MAG: hypothetical protein HUK03_08220 [Bacteroidaceae bacterium]|nr:hypothetical protein [Bacteroidaceae bacterium]